MKRFLKGGLLTLVCATLLCASVDAKYVYYTNEAGVEMTELEYEKMVKIYSKRYVKHMSQENFDLYKNANIISDESVYYKTTYEDGVVVEEEEITAEEYANAPEGAISEPGIAPLSGDYKYLETSYKKLGGTLAEFSSTQYSLIGALDWKKVPYCRSYDVFAFRLRNFSYSGFVGSQVYYVNGVYNIIRYDQSSPGYKAQSNGAGVSMNLVDGSNITGYDMTIGVDLATSGKGEVYLSYQHTQSDVTREQSKGYTLNINGLGNVILFSNSTIASKYDGMGGVHLTN